MAFNLTASVTTRLANGGQLASQIRKEIGIVPVKIRFDGVATGKISETTNLVKTLNAQLIALNANSRLTADGIKKLGSAFSGFGQGIRTVEKAATATKKSTQATKEATDSIAEFGRISGLALRRNAGFILATASIYGLGRAVVSSFKDAVDFEKELVKVAQVSNRSTASLRPLVTEITRLSVSLGVSSKDLLGVSVTLAQAGLSATETKQALEALAKTTLAATFGDINQTTEGSIALMAQFGIKAKDLEKALSSANSVAAAFAVESEDIVVAVKRAGGVFAQTSKGVAEGRDAFEQFIATFTSVRATTRESAESIATGLRTIFTRIQRPQTLEFLKELGIELRDVEGKFVGPFEAINRLSAGLQNVDRRGAVFAGVSEQLGGFRQIGHTLALLTSSDLRQKALTVAQQGEGSLAKDAIQAQESLANAITKTREEFAAFIRELSQTNTFQLLVRDVLGLAHAMIQLAQTLKPIIPLITVFAAFKGLTVASRFVPKFKEGLGIKAATGGLIRGGKGGVDDIPAMLTAGEFVINKKSASIIGRKNLDDLNRVGFARGGPVIKNGIAHFASGGGVDDELARAIAQLEKLDRKLGAGQGAKKERARLNEVVRRLTLRTETINPALSGLFRGSQGPAFEATVGGITVSGNTGQELNDRLANREHNIRQERLQRLEQPRIQAIEAARQLGNQPALSGSTVTGLKNKAQNIANDAVTNLLNNIKGTVNRVTKNVQPTLFNKGTTDDAILSSIANTKFVKTTRPAGVRNVLTNTAILRILNGPENNRSRNQLDLFDSNVGVSPEGRLHGPSQFRQLSPTAQALADSFLGSPTVETERARRGGRFSVSRLSRNINSIRGIGGFIGQQFPTFGSALFGSEGQQNGFQRAASGIRTRLGGNAGLLAAAGLITGGTLLGEKIGGTTGGAISGAAGGAAAGLGIGAVFGPVGAGVGLAVGGIIGAFNGFIQADLDAKIKKASDSMIKSIGSIENAITEFDANVAKDPSFDNFAKSFVKAAGSFSGTSRKIINQDRAARGEKLIEDPSDSQFIRRDSLSQTDRRHRADIVNQQNTELKNFETRQSELASASEAAQKLLQAELDRGVNFDQAVNNLGSQGQVVLAFGNAKTKSQKEGLAQALASGDEGALFRTSRAQLLGGDLRLENEERQKANDLLKKSAEAIQDSNQQADFFIERMQNLSAVFDRVSQAGDNFRKQNESILSRRSGGAGIVSQQRVNIFDNLRGFTAKEVGAEADRLGGLLGNNKNTRELVSGVKGAKELQDKLPSVLQELNKKTRIGGSEEASVALPGLINKNFSNLPAVLRNQLVENINHKFFSNKQGSPGDLAQQLTGGDITPLTDPLTKQTIEAFKKLTDVMNKNTAEFEDALNTWVGLQNEANKAEDDRIQIQIDNANIEKQLLGQQRLSVEDRSRGFGAQLSQFAGRAGLAGPISVNKLSEIENLINNQRSAPQKGTSDEIAKRFTEFSNRQNSAVEALKLIATNTDRQVALQTDLNSLIDSRKAARQIFEDFQFGTPTEKREIERKITLARRQLDGAILSPFQSKQAREGQQLLSTLTGAVQGPDAVQALDKKFIDLLDRGDAGRLFDIAGLNPGVGVGGLLNNKDALFQGQFQQLQNLNQQRAQAQFALGNINQRDANQFLGNAQEKFNAVQQGLQDALANGGLLDKLNNTLQNFPVIPEKVEVVGTVNGNIQIHGAEAFAAIAPALNKLVEDKLTVELNKRLNPLTGATTA